MYLNNIGDMNVSGMQMIFVKVEGRMETQMQKGKATRGFSERVKDFFK